RNRLPYAAHHWSLTEAPPPSSIPSFRFSSAQIEHPVSSTVAPSTSSAPSLAVLLAAPPGTRPRRCGRSCHGCQAQARVAVPPCFLSAPRNPSPCPAQAPAVPCPLLRPHR